MGDYEEDEELIDETEKGCVISPDTGMPYMDEDESEDKVKGSIGTVIGFLVVPRLISAGIACAIYFPKKDMYDGRMHKVTAVIDGLGYLYLAGFLFSFILAVSNNFPMIYKSAIMPGNAGNLRSNMAIYKVSQTNLPYVVMEEAGYIGKYNRANRAMYHFVENGMGALVCTLLGGIIFGEAVLVLVAIYALARFWYQIAYSSGGYGIGCCKHAVPFLIHTFLVHHILEMLVFGTGWRMVNLPMAVAPAAA